MKKSIVLAMSLAAVISQAQLIVGNDQTGVATIWSIDVSTGVATALYSANNINAKPWGMAADNGSSTLYWNNGGTLFSASFASLLSGTPSISQVTMTFNAGAVNYVALAFNPSSGKLLGTRNIATEAVYEIDPVTGVSTQLYVHPTTFDFGGLEVDTTTGKLYGLSDTAPTGGVRGLYEIDVPGQTQTFRAPYPAGETDIDALAVNNGLAYYVTDGPNTTQANFYVFDIASGTQVGTIPSPLTGSGTFAGATWAPGLLVPEPMTMAMLGLGAFALIRRRKR